MGQSGALFSKDYSFQFDRGPSVVYGEDAPYILRARFTPSGRKQEIWSDWAVSDEEWDAFTAFAGGDPSGRTAGRQLGKSRPAPSITLTANSSRRNWIRKQRSSSGRIFTELALCLLDEQP